MKSKLKKGDALLLVDVQYDFLPGGALGIDDADKILPIINDWIAAAQAAHVPIIISRDWHPAHHISFKERGGPWPAHCVQDTKGAAFHSSLNLPTDVIVVNKAFEKDKDVYSAMQGVTNREGLLLTEKLKQLKIKRLWVAGLAFDYCVHYTSLDAHKLGFIVNIVLPACRSISSSTEQKSFQEMTAIGINLELDSKPYQQK